MFKCRNPLVHDEQLALLLQLPNSSK
jgi:hypothetical protein